MEDLDLTSYDNWLNPKAKFNTKTGEIIYEDGTREQRVK